MDFQGLLCRILEELQNKVTIVPELVIPDQIIIERILNRATCSNKECGAIYNTKFKPPKVEGKCDVCGAELVIRTDDNEETIKNRLDVYRKNSKELIEFYKEKGVLATITPKNTETSDTEQVANEILNLIKN